MDGRILVSVFAAVISTACTVQNPAANPLENIKIDSVEEIDAIPFFRSLPEEPEPYYNQRMYSPPSYGYGNMMMHPPRRPYHHPYGPGYPRPMYMDLPPRIPHKWGPPYPAPYPAPDPPTIAYWLSKFSMNKPNEQPDINKIQNATNATTTTTTTTTTIAPTTETITETTTQILEVETTETPKQQTDEPGEEPKQRQLPTKKAGKDCGPDEEPIEASTTVANEQQPPITTTSSTTTAAAAAAAAASEPVSTSQETSGNVPAASVAPLIKAAPSEEEVVSLATLRRNPISIHPEMALPPMYPGKSLYGPAYPPMPYLPEMPLDPYAEYRRIGHHPMYPRIPERYYGF